MTMLDMQAVLLRLTAHKRIQKLQNVTDRPTPRERQLSNQNNTDQSVFEREAPTFRKDNCSRPPTAQYVEARGMIEVSFESL